MNPQVDKPATFNLPPPVPEVGQPPMPEAGPAAVDTTLERAPQPPAAPALAVPVPPPLPVAPVSQQQALPANDVGTTTTPSKADDDDLIEKEWVKKAKEIIEKTKEDPYQQSKQISTIKTDYIKKRYNKDVKLVEE